MTELHVNFTQKRHDLYDRRNVKNRLGNIIAIVGSMWPLGSEFEPALQRGRKDRALAPGPLSDGGNKIAPKNLTAMVPACTLFLLTGDHCVVIVVISSKASP